MGVSLADLVAQMLAEPTPKKKKGDGTSPCPLCRVSPRVRYSNGEMSSYCIGCRKIKAKEYREIYAAKAVSKNN